MPPRSLKSICASVALPAWLLGHDPTRRIICASYAQELSVKLANDFRLVVTSDWYRRLFPHTRLDPQKNTETEVVTTARGYRLATSVGGVLTGRGADLIVIDDPMKPQDALSDTKRQAVQQWFDTTLLSRLDDQGRAVRSCWSCSACMSRISPAMSWPRRAGRISTCRRSPRPPPISRSVQDASTGDVPARCCTRPATATPRWSGSAARWAATPSARSTSRTLCHWTASCSAGRGSAPTSEAPERQAGDLVTQSWDTASKAEEIHDWSACTTWLRRGADHYLLDVWRGRLDYPSLKRQVVALARRWRADVVLIEDKGSGTQLIQDLRAEGVVRPIAILPEGDKRTRFYTQCAKIEAGHVLLPAAAPWLDAFRRELLQFPHGRHDDQVDSVSQYLAYRSALHLPRPTSSLWAVPSLSSGTAPSRLPAAGDGHGPDVGGPPSVSPPAAGADNRFYSAAKSPRMPATAPGPSSPAQRAEHRGLAQITADRRQVRAGAVVADGGSRLPPSKGRAGLRRTTAL